MSNLPEVKIGVVAVSRDCFPESLSVNRRKALMKAYTEKYGTDSVYECPVCIVESEIHMVQALEDIKKAGCNALCVYLGNFGPEISETLLAKHFDGPAMFIAAAEETQNDLVGGRGDAYCGMLNASYNLKLRNVKAYIPENPVGTAAECADMPVSYTHLDVYKRQVLEYHIEKKADITVVCRDMEAGTNVERFGTIRMNEESRIEEFEEKPLQAKTNTISCGIYVVRRRLLIEMIEKCAEEDRYDFVRDILIRYKDLKRIYGYKIKDYWRNIASVDDYYSTNMDFLKADVRNYFFKQYPDVYSKVDDLPPAKYNPGSQVRNSLEMCIRDRS